MHLLIIQNLISNFDFSLVGITNILVLESSVLISLIAFERISFWMHPVQFQILHISAH
jgi:hypothetical protein